MTKRAGSRQNRRRTNTPADVDQASDLGAGVRRVAIYAQDGSLLRLPTAVIGEREDPDDTNPMRRSRRKIKGAQALDMLGLLRSWTSVITKEHVVAADRLAADYEQGVLNGYPRQAGFLVEPHGNGPAQYFPPEQRLRHLQSFREAMLALGETAGEVVMLVVIYPPERQKRTVRYLAEMLDVNRQQAVGIVKAALDRLVEHYEPTQSTWLDKIERGE